MPQHLPQTLVDNIKYEILSDPQFRNIIYSNSDSLSTINYPGYHPKTFDLNDQQYIIDTIKADILKDLGYTHTNHQTSYQTNNQNNYQSKVNNPDPMKMGMQERLSHMLNNGQLKGVLYGLGTAALAALILPSTGRKFQSVAVKTVEDGMDLMDRARSVVARAKEGIEDVLAEANYKRYQSVFSENFPEDTDMIVEPAYERIRKDKE